MGYRWTFVLLAWMAQFPTTYATEPIIAIEDALDTVVVCNDHATGDCKRLTCMEICLKDASTDPLECPSYCNLHAKGRTPANFVAKLRD